MATTVGVRTNNSSEIVSRLLYGRFITLVIIIIIVYDVAAPSLVACLVASSTQPDLKPDIKLIRRRLIHRR